MVANEVRVVRPEGVEQDGPATEVRDAVEQQFDVTVEDVNTMVTAQGTKKATVQLSADDDAQEVASRIGVF